MAAQGLGNIEIAQSLFVTRKTVEKLLSSVYTKLDVSSRAALSSHFLEEGADAAVPGRDASANSTHPPS
jgi:DNA-binding CsgD family transcriptional regulator